MSEGKKRKGFGKPWSEQEKQILRVNYRNVGAQGAQKRLAKWGYERSIDAISAKARNLKLFYDPTAKGDVVFLHEAMNSRADLNHPHAHADIIRAAKEDGVVSRSETYPHKYMAPAWWVDEYVERKYQEKHEADELLRNWLSTKEVAELFDISMDVLYSMIRPSLKKQLPLSKSLNAITRKKLHAGYGDGFRYGWVWKPDEARFYATQYKKRRAKWRPSKYTYG